MADITTNDPPPNEPGRPPVPVQLPVTNISQWVECFSLKAAILYARLPHKAPELLTYKAVIIRVKQNYEGTRWVSHDRQSPSTEGPQLIGTGPIQASIYSKAFTGQAKDIAYYACRMITSTLPAPGIPTALYWVGSPSWTHGQCRSSPNRWQLSYQQLQQYPGKFIGNSTKGRYKKQQ